MKYRTLIILIAIALVSLAPAADVFAQRQAQGTNGSGRSAPDRVSAAAHLEGIGTVEGWGRAMVADTTREEVLQRSLTVRFFDLEPDTEYSVEIDGLQLGFVLSDDLGDGWLRFGGSGGDFPPVPEELPSATELFVIQVLDPSLAVTLEGEFTLMEYGGMQWEGLVYHERISLIEVETGSVGGMARVARDADDVQAFESQGCRLIAGDSYRLFVDGFLVDVVVADSVGQVSLSLSTGDEDNPLPSEMQPIEDLRLVEWKNADGDVILTSSFTGENMVGAGSQGENGGHGENGENGGDNGGDNGGNGGQGGNGGDNGQGGNGGDNGQGGDGECTNP